MSRWPCMGNPVPGAISSSFKTIRLPNGSCAALLCPLTAKWCLDFSQIKSLPASESTFRICSMLLSKNRQIRLLLLLGADCTLRVDGDSIVQQQTEINGLK